MVGGLFCIRQLLLLGVDEGEIGQDGAFQERAFERLRYLQRVAEVGDRFIVAAQLPQREAQIVGGRQQQRGIAGIDLRCLAVIADLTREIVRLTVDAAQALQRLGLAAWISDLDKYGMRLLQAPERQPDIAGLVRNSRTRQFHVTVEFCDLTVATGQLCCLIDGLPRSLNVVQAGQRFRGEPPASGRRFGITL